MALHLITLITAIIAGFGTGLLGIGGGIIIYPVFLFLVPLLGFEILTVNQISGVTTIQIVSGSLFSFFAHRKSRPEFKPLPMIVSAAIIGALAGSLLSVYFSAKVLLSFYLFILVTSLISMTRFKDSEIKGCKNPNNSLIYMICLGTSFLAGTLGLGGAILYIPMLRYFFCLTTKETIGIVTLIVFTGALMTCTGKMITGQIPYDLIVYTVLGSFSGAKIGAFVSKKTRSEKLRKILIMLIACMAIRVFIEVLI